MSKIKSWQLLSAAAAVLFAAEWGLSNIVVNPEHQLNTREKCERELAQAGLSLEDWERNWQKEDIAIRSRYGYTLRGAVIPHDPACPPADGRTRVVVIVHGYTVNLIASMKYVAIFRQLGFECVVYDQRNHGLSDHALTTMGRREAEDLETVCQWVRKHYGQNCILGTHGESMGAATVMLHSAIDHHLAFAIEDCGYSSLKEQLAWVMQTRYHLPPALLLYPCMAVAWLRTGVRFSQVEPAKAVARSGNTPMLFIHGDADTYVPYKMLQKNYDSKCTGPCRKAVFPGAAHAMSLLSDPERYRRVIETFLQDYHIL
ncbi:alpha/beta fold hydrolase [uncultured Gemmiger sp.]|uniref:alpha/beta hydrolase n=1 Tax=uncultured Gemmiger sp. TaxID=1623490 RepID=UPI0025CD8337|nr:alpha/beta fold hydrolase [uncultured Gemmiger sp.]